MTDNQKGRVIATQQLGKTAGWAFTAKAITSHSMVALTHLYSAPITFETSLFAAEINREDRL